MGRKARAFPFGACFRSACNHPIIVCMLCFLAILYRLSPFVFSLLVSAFPVIFCTGVLLGVLLSFSQQKPPEFELKEGVNHRVLNLGTVISRSVSFAQRDDAYRLQRLIDGETSNYCSSDDDTCSEKDDDDTDGSLSDIGSRVADRSQKIWFVRRSQRGLYNAGFELLNKEEHNHGFGVRLSCENFELGSDKSVGSWDSKRVSVGSTPCLASLGKHEDDDDDDDEEISDSGSDRPESSSRDDASISGSDRAESTSRDDDASVAGIVPMPDELHPLLDEEAPQPVNVSQNDSEATSEHFSRTSDSCSESGNSTEEQTELQVEDDEDEGNKDNLAKGTIRWTEEDQKSVMEVGSSELKRNQILERVMERRRSRKCVSMMAVNELISLESSGPQHSFAPIVTTRQNPFDLLPESYEEGLPPIPGSAPSVLNPGRNPFDVPYYSTEEKSDLSGENSQLNFLDFQRRGYLNPGPSIFGQSKQEQMASEGTSYSTFYAQLNGLGDSKVSSGHETESLGSVEDLEDKNVIKERMLISKIENASEHVGHGSHSSEEEEEDDDDDDDDDDDEDSLGGLKNIVVDEIVKKPSVNRYRSNSPSSSTTSSEASERIFVEKEKPSVAVNGYSRQASSLDGSEMSSSSTLVEDCHRREPVYDSSPPRFKRNFSSSSIASDMHEPLFPHLQVKRTVSFSERVILIGSNRDSEIHIPTVKEMLESSGVSKPVNADESESREASGSK